jgi:hypothetical protein
LIAKRLQHLYRACDLAGIMGLRVGFRLLLVLHTLLFGLAASLQPASATIFCEVLSTPDGFLALRAEPNAKAVMLRKLKPGESVQVGEDKKGAWFGVTVYLNQDTPSTDDDGQVSGWVHGKYLAKECG